MCTYSPMLLDTMKERSSLEVLHLPGVGGALQSKPSDCTCLQIPRAVSTDQWLDMESRLIASRLPIFLISRILSCWAARGVV